MIERPFWRRRIEEGWREAPIVWLSGVRRCGKTTLAQSFGREHIYYLNCDLPIVEEMVRDPELFYRECKQPMIVFDEVHQLRDPSRILKIGADGFPHLKILATGSSTLSASHKFRDTLTGRKRMVHLLPVLWDELTAFDKATLQKRLLHGGLPPALLSTKKNASFYREWADSFFARDIQKLFAFREVDKFNTLFEYIMKQSGGLIEVSKVAAAVGISRPTVENHLRAMEITHALTLIRPFHGGGRKELVKMPKGYGFDTGFVSFFRGWEPLRPADCGVLWEHLVLEYLTAHRPYEKFCYWRDLAGREIDFIWMHGRDQVDIIECKWNPAELDIGPLKLFRSYYPKGKNYVISPMSVLSHPKRFGSLEVLICNPEGWLESTKHA